MKTQCANCQAYYHADELVYPIPDLHERVDPGEPVPEGECPVCGALCHAVEHEVWVEVANGGVISVSVPESLDEKIVVKLIDNDCPPQFITRIAPIVREGE